MGAVLAGAAIALAILFGRHGVDEQVVLVPAADGHIGTVVIQHNGKQTILNTAYAAFRVEDGQAMNGVVVPSDDVKRDFGAALEGIPARPASFTLYFLTGTDELTDESKLEMQRVLDELRRRPAPDIQVIGHTDTVGSDQENDSLSLQRAQTLREEMLQLGIPGNRIRAAGRGKREPLVRTADGVDEPRNRRVEINVR